MRLPLYSLRTGIMAQLVFLILAAMLLIHVAEMKFSENSLTQAKMQACRLAALAIQENLAIILKDTDPRAPFRDPALHRATTGLLMKGGFTDGLLLDLQGEPCWSEGPRPDDQVLGLARETLESSAWSSRFVGTTWGVIWLAPRDVIASSPLFVQGKIIGAVAFRAPLVPIYETLRSVQKIVIAYILLDAMVLTLVGILLLSRIVVRPIRKLLRIASEYKDGGMILLPTEASTNEIGELSRSLTLMLKRLDENKRELKDHIASLEKANAELQKVQSDLIRSEKLASVGRLAAGVAHEIGNPISISLGYLELLRKDDVTEEERADFTARLEMEISRINRIIRQLLDFSRPSSVRQEQTRVHAVLSNSLNILSPQPMLQGVEVRYLPEAADDLLDADPSRLQQVFVNIMMNAADALAEEGFPGERLLLIRTSNSDGKIAIEFKDTGRGIPHEELSHIFDPFYTTKEPGKGTGLGLSVSYRIVESMGGMIRVESEEGRGASFLVTLPLKIKGRK